MNNRQKEILQVYIDDEKRVLKDLKTVYKKALDDIDSKIAELLGREDANLQNVIYQVDYQKALKQQINGILDTMNSNQFTTVSDYLTKCYENGFVGVMYDLQKQGIPLIMPIDQEQIQKALVHDTKLSKSLYQALGEDVNQLKRRVASNLSRGIAQSQSYADIARNIAAGTNIGLNKTMRIARTEGHRIAQEATYHAQKKAVEKGADVVKQWDATIDRRTRSHHAQLDGQIREIDEPFEVDGHKAQYPGAFGVASEDVNCRCAVLQRAKWALDEDELKTLQDRAEYFGLDKTEDFDDFKQKYLQSVHELEKEIEDNENGNAIQLDINNFSPTFLKGTSKKKTKQLVDYVNSLNGSNPNALKLYNSIGKMDNFESNGIKFSVSYANTGHALGSSGSRLTGKYTEIKLTIPKLEGENIAGQVNTTLHEQMHLIDLMLKDNPTGFGTYFTASSKKVVDVFEKTTSDIGSDVLDLFKKHNAEYDALVKQARKAYNEGLEELKQLYIPNGVFGAGSDYTTYNKLSKKLWKDVMETGRDYEARNIMGGGIGNLQDIYDALSRGTFRGDGTVLYGHGKDYFRVAERCIDEIIANYGSLSVTRPDLIEMLRKDKPELCDALDEILKEMVKKVDSLA